MKCVFVLQELVALTGIGKKRSQCVIIYQVCVYLWFACYDMLVVTVYILLTYFYVVYVGEN